MTEASSSTVILEEIDCPLCGESKHRLVVESEDHQWGIAGRFSVVECDQCRHRFMNPRPLLSLLADCYPDNYGPHQLNAQPQPANESATSNVSSAPWYLRYLPLRYIPGLRRFFYWLTDERSQSLPAPFTVENGETPRAFELGCAAGAYLAQLQNKGWNVSGVEPGDAPVRSAQANGLDVQQGTLDNISPNAKSFDFAASWMVIEHVPHPRQTLQQLHRILKPEGTLAISVPNAGCWEPKFFGANWDAWDLPRHLHHFSPRSIRRLLSECGFTNIRITHQRTLLNVFGSVGIFLIKRNPSSRIGNWFLRYPHSPTLAVQLVAAPIAHFLAFFRQSGRLTITATRATDEDAARATQTENDA